MYFICQYTYIKAGIKYNVAYYRKNFRKYKLKFLNIAAIILQMQKDLQVYKNDS